MLKYNQSPLTRNELRKLITTGIRFLIRLRNKDLKMVRCFYWCKVTLNLRAKRLSHPAWGHSHWAILQTLNFSTLGYCLSVT